MKQFFALLLSFCLLCSLSGCSLLAFLGEYEDPALQTGVLYADFSCGEENEEKIKEYPFEYTGERKTGEELAEELSLLTGLDFTVTVTEIDGELWVDWAPGSTLIAGLGDREMKEEFSFSDADTLRWFMMDSLRRTLLGNSEAEAVYYLSDGEDLAFPELYPVREFSSDEPYRGSCYYYEQAGSSSENPNLKLKGEWLYSDQENVLVFDELGNYNWSFVDDVWFGTYTFDGETVKFYNADGDHLTNATLGDQGRLFVEGDAGSYYYRSTE